MLQILFSLFLLFVPPVLLYLGFKHKKTKINVIFMLFYSFCFIFIFIFIINYKIGLNLILYKFQLYEFLLLSFLLPVYIFYLGFKHKDKAKINLIFMLLFSFCFIFAVDYAIGLDVILYESDNYPTFYFEKFINISHNQYVLREKESRKIIRCHPYSLFLNYSTYPIIPLAYIRNNIHPSISILSPLRE